METAHNPDFTPLCKHLFRPPPCMALPTAAQQMQGDEHIRGMQGGPMQGMQGMTIQNINLAQQEFHASMQKMNQAMMQGLMDPDPGKAWMKQMIAHHQGAVEMSEIVRACVKTQTSSTLANYSYNFMLLHCDFHGLPVVARHKSAPSQGRSAFSHRLVLKHSEDDDVVKEARKTREQNEKDMKELQAELRRKDR